MDLPPEVIAEIKANRKIEAIKLLRGSQGIGLKEAKEAVDDYIEREQPEMVSRSRNGGGDHKLFLIAVAIVAVYLAYRFFN